MLHEGSHRDWRTSALLLGVTAPTAPSSPELRPCSKAHYDADCCCCCSACRACAPALLPGTISPLRAPLRTPVRRTWRPAGCHRCCCRLLRAGPALRGCTSARGAWRRAEATPAPRPAVAVRAPIAKPRHDVASMWVPARVWTEEGAALTPATEKSVKQVARAI